MVKNILIVVFALAALFGAERYLDQVAKTKAAEARLSLLEKQLADVKAEAEKHERRAETLNTRLQESRTVSATRSTQMAELKQELTNQVAQAKSKSNPLADMFKNQETRDLIRAQQKMVLGGMMDKLYKDLFSQLNLSPEQGAALKEMLLNRSLKDAEVGVAMMAGDTDASQRADLMKQTKADKDAINAEIKQQLGDQAYSQLEAYDKSLPDRITVGTFKDQVAAGANAISTDQEAQLMQALGTARQNFKFTTDFSDPTKYGNDFGSMFTEANMNQFAQETGQLVQQYLAAAQNILSPEQYTAFQNYLNTQQQMQAAGIKMAGQLFGNQPKK